MTFDNSPDDQPVAQKFDATPFVSIDEEGTKHLDIIGLLKTPAGLAKFKSVIRNIGEAYPPSPIHQPDTLEGMLARAAKRGVHIQLWYGGDGKPYARAYSGHVDSGTITAPTPCAALANAFAKIGKVG